MCVRRKIACGLVEVGARLQDGCVTHLEETHHRILCHVLGIMPIAQAARPSPDDLVVVGENPSQPATGHGFGSRLSCASGPGRIVANDSYSYKPVRSIEQRIWN